MPSFMDKLTVDGNEMDMYAAVPEGSGPFPAVVIAFHVGGMDEFDKVMADRFADEGYVAVVPDLFHRYTDEQLNGGRLERLKLFERRRRNQRHERCGGLSQGQLGHR